MLLDSTCDQEEMPVSLATVYLERVPRSVNPIEGGLTVKLLSDWAAFGILYFYLAALVFVAWYHVTIHATGTTDICAQPSLMNALFTVLKICPDIDLYYPEAEAEFEFEEPTSNAILVRHERALPPQVSYVVGEVVNYALGYAAQKATALILRYTLLLMVYYALLPILTVLFNQTGLTKMLMEAGETDFPEDLVIKAPGAESNPLELIMYHHHKLVKSLTQGDSGTIVFTKRRRRRRKR